MTLERIPGLRFLLFIVIRITIRFELYVLVFGRKDKHLP